MKKLLFTIIFAISLSLNAQTNIVSNGTFEDGTLTGWNTLSQNGAQMSVTADGTNPLSGTKSMLVNILSADPGLQLWTQKVSWRLSLTKNAIYKVSFKAKASIPTTLKGYINRYNAPWQDVSLHDYSITTTVQNFEFTTDPISHVLGADYSFDFYVGQISTGTKVWIDDVSIVEVTSPPTDGNLCNGDFENDVLNSPYPYTNPQTLLYGWTKNDYGRGYIQYSIDNSAPITGTNSFKAHSVNGPDDNGWRSQLMWQFTPIVGQQYMLEFDAKSDVAFSMNTEAFVEYTGGVRPNNLFNQTFNITTGTNHYKLALPSAVVTKTPDLGSYTLAFWLGLLPTGKNVWIDNVKIYSYVPNILTNGTFEDGTLTGWNTLSQNGAQMSVTADGTNPLSGTKSMHVNILSADAGLQLWTQKISWRLSLTKNAVYKVSFKAKASIPTTLKGYIDRYNAPWQDVSSHDYSITTTVQNFEFTTEPISHVLGADYSFDFYVGQIPTGTQVWIDDVSIVEVTSPPTDGNLCNGDFENDVLNSPYPYTNPQTLLYGWTKNDYGRGYIQYSIDNTTPISGTNSFKAHSVNGPDDNGWRSQLMWQFAPVVGQKYILEFDAKSDVAFSMTTEAFVEYAGSVRPNDLFKQAFNITTGTHHYKISSPSAVVTKTPDLGSYTLAFWLGLLPTGKNVWIDNVKIYQDVPILNPVTVHPVYYPGAIRNPMKGFREFFSPGIDQKRMEYPYPYGTLTKEYMQWNMMENGANDGLDKVISYSNHRWVSNEDINMKIIPRAYLVWMEPWHGGVAKNTTTTNPDDLNGWHWAADMPGESGYVMTPTNTPITGGYFTGTSFSDRVKALVAKLGQAWDNDPRVAYVEMGIIGEWGEHHDPCITTTYPPIDQPTHVVNRTYIPGIETILGDAFTTAFKNKKVMVRYAYEFKNYNFGVYWDSWAIDNEKERGYQEMLNRGDYWKTQPVGGEVTWAWGDLAGTYHLTSFEACAEHSVVGPRIIEQIRNLHCNHLGGITWANFNDPTFRPYADSIQKSLGYRFILNDFTYPSRIEYNKPFSISFNVTNVGSSPFYYKWPVEISLLDATTKSKVWSKILTDVDISSWMPGENWNTTTKRYTTTAPINNVYQIFNLDKQLPAAKYIIAMSILDPAGNLPSIRLATANYFTGGIHPIGYIGVGYDNSSSTIDPSNFNDLATDNTLKYIPNINKSNIEAWGPESNEGTMTVTEDAPISATGANSIHVNIATNTGTNIATDYWKQKMRYRWSIAKTAKYHVRFNAKANTNLSIIGKFEQFFSPYTPYSAQTFNLGSTVQTFDFTTTAMPNVVGAGCFDFYYGHLPAGSQVYISDFKIEEVAPLSDGNVCNGDFENDVANLGYDSSPILYGWNTADYGGTVNFSIDNTSSAISGTKSMKMTAHAAPVGAGWKSQLFWTFVPVKGKSYTLQFKAKATTNMTITAEAFTQNGTTRPNDLFKQNFNITTSTQTYSLTIYSDIANLYANYYLAFWVGTIPNGQSLWIDDVKINQLYPNSGLLTDPQFITGINNSEITNNYATIVNNPTTIQGYNNQIVINSDKIANAYVYSITGQLLKVYKLYPGINSEFFQKGIYIVQVNNGNIKTKSAKIAL